MLVTIGPEEAVGTRGVDDAEERQPLLRKSSSESFASCSGPPSKPSDRWSWFPRNPLNVTVTDARFRRIPLIACLIILANEGDFFMNHIPMLRMIEAMRCVEFYEADDPSIISKYGFKIPEKLCKGEYVQKQVATTMGLNLFWRIVASLIGAIYLGPLADRTGRKWVLVLNKLGWVLIGVGHLLIYLTFPLLPLWTMYVVNGFSIIGGNYDFGLAILFASVTDVVPSDAERTALFFLISSMLSVAQAFCPPLGGFLMDLDGKGGTPWVPFVIGIMAGGAAVVLTAVAFPETLEKPVKSPVSSQDDLASIHSLEAGMIPHVSWTSRTCALKDLTITYARRRWVETQNAVVGIGVASMVLLSFAMLCVSVGTKGLDWQGFMQYATLKLGWKFSQTSIVMSVQACINLINFAVIIPFLTTSGTRRLGSAARAKLAILAGSTGLLTAGGVLTGLSTSNYTFLAGISVYTLGEGFPTAMQAYTASMIERSKIARVLSTLSLAQTVAKLIVSLAFPKVLAVGLDSHVPALVGLPCFAAAVLFVIAAVCLLLHHSCQRGT
ncbi:MAG: hypothetical protein M1827_002512 [Pycnora praestabilis]|nr:MAG: hypothetical protein M1827_002512 [Pycnora praestabilis]